MMRRGGTISLNVGDRRVAFAEEQVVRPLDQRRNQIERLGQLVDIDGERSRHPATDFVVRPAIAFGHGPPASRDSLLDFSLKGLCARNGLGLGSAMVQEMPPRSAFPSCDIFAAADGGERLDR
jgi:hypothetical protein